MKPILILKTYGNLAHYGIVQAGNDSAQGHRSRGGIEPILLFCNFATDHGQELSNSDAIMTFFGFFV
jgi:hypothetical protein